MNFVFDFILLLATSIILKRKVKIYKLFLGALFGSLSIFFMFLRLNSLKLFILKFVISLFMIFISFGYKNFRYMLKNIYYLYTISIVLGGFLYFIDISFSYKNTGLIFINTGLSINFIIAIILSPLIIYLYIKQTKELKNNYNKYYNVVIELKNQKINLTGFLDTGNKLIDPYRKRPIILINKNLIKYEGNKLLIVPYHTVNNGGLLRCICANKILIDGILYKKKYLIGLSENIMLDGVDCILNDKILEG